MATSVPIAEPSSTFAVVVTVPPSVIVKLLVPTLVKECIVYPPLCVIVPPVAFGVPKYLSTTIPEPPAPPLEFPPVEVDAPPPPPPVFGVPETPGLFCPAVPPAPPPPRPPAPPPELGTGL